MYNLYIMKIATWNVNSIGVRLQHVLQWLDTNRPDVLSVQEIKCIDAKFPAAAFREAGYHIEIFGQPTYNGVAIISRAPVSDVRRGFLDDDESAQKRVIAATAQGVRVVNVYIPNGQEVGSEKYAFKLAWLGRLRKYFDDCLDPADKLVLCGDFNVAMEDRDIHDPVLWAGKILCSPQERDAMRTVQDWGLVDLYRRFHEEPGQFSWWDYRAGAFPKNHGLRIDHLWATPSLAALCTGAWIDKVPRMQEKPSDHAPVVAEFAL
jgi:exodeoxyribonuclease III